MMASFRICALFVGLPLTLTFAGTLPASAATCPSDLAACTTVAFPATGQTTAYLADKNDGLAGPVTVPDDGLLEAGADPLFVDNGDGTITDLRTGLMWEKKGDNGGLHDKDNIYWWSGNGVEETVWDWIEDVNREGVFGFAGYTDWRIPNVRELLSLANLGAYPLSAFPAFHQNCVPNATVISGSCTFLGGYWSSTTRLETPTQALQVNFNEGYPMAYLKSSTGRVRAVRYACGSELGCPSQYPASGQTTAFSANKNDGIKAPVAVPDDGTLEAGAPLAFVDNGDGTITDLNTGLTWEKKSDDGGLHDKDRALHWSGNGSAFQETVWDWLEDVNSEGGTGFAGHDDWRLPNARELETLIHYEVTQLTVAPIFDQGCVPGSTVLSGSCTFKGQHWTSTTRARSTTMAWGVSFRYGELFPYEKTTALRVRAVRGGTP